MSGSRVLRVVAFELGVLRRCIVDVQWHGWVGIVCDGRPALACYELPTGPLLIVIDVARCWSDE
jgi:hypothetical protein